MGNSPLGGVSPIVRRSGEMDKNLRSDVCTRLRCIEGHTRGIRRMVVAEAELREIIHQLNAVQGSIKRVKSILIQAYLSAQLPGAIEGKVPDDQSRILVQFVELLNSPE